MYREPEQELDEVEVSWKFAYSTQRNEIW